MNRIRRVAGYTVGLALLGLLGACGRMEPKAQVPATEAAPAAPPPPPLALQEREEDGGEPTTLADAEALLEKARADLDRLALNTAPGAPAAAGAAAPAPASVPRLSPKRDEAARADKAPSMSAADDTAAPPAPKEASTCETACKAFSSLTRASDAVCRLDTDGGKRCERARQIRADASQRVASCGCAK